MLIIVFAYNINRSFSSATRRIRFTLRIVAYQCGKKQQRTKTLSSSFLSSPLYIRILCSARILLLMLMLMPDDDATE